MSALVLVLTVGVLVAIAAAARTIHRLRDEVAELVDARDRGDTDPERDALTGAANWSGLMVHLRRARGRRTDSDQDIGIVALDVGAFGALNATMGRAAGDLVLTTIADRLDTQVRTGELLARTSGARFVVVLEAPITAYGATRAATRFVDAMRVPIAIGAETVTIDAHAGVAVGCRQDGELLIDDAQTALTKARKDAAAYPVLFNDALRNDTARNFHQAQQLKTAVAAGELYLAYQPIHRTHDGALAAIEALLRWDSRTFGPVSPVDFIPIAEDTGAIVEIGAWVLRKACEDLRIFSASHPDVMMSVNVSPHQLRHKAFHELIESVVVSTDTDPTRLQLEITESTLARPEDVRETLDRIRSLGVRIALDDVGTGYSSLAQIAALRVDAIKLDRSLISRIGSEDTGVERVFTSLAALGQSLGLDVIAEGIETRDQARFALDAGCTHEQGFLYSRPEKLADAVAYAATATPVRTA